MSSYKTYLIYDMKSGLRLDKEPWLLPQDAFETLEDCFLKQGVLEKRRGSTLFAQMVHVDTATKAPTLQTTTVMGIYNHYTSAGVETLLVIDTQRFNKYLTSPSLNKTITHFSDGTGGEVVVTCVGHGFVTPNVVTISGTTNYDGTYEARKTGDNTFRITATWAGDDATGTANQEKLLDLTRNSIRFKHASKQNWTPAADDVVKGATSGATATVLAVVVDTGTFAGSDANGTIIFKNATVSGTFQDAEELQENGTASNKAGDSHGTATDGELAGDDADFIWFENRKGVAYFTNNQDQIRKYDGSYVTKFNIDLDVEGGPDNDVNTCLLIFHMEGRTILLRTTERAVARYQRLRWSEINSTTFKDAKHTDAPRDDMIMGADFIGGELIVWFERGVMKIVYTGDPDTPLKWEKVDSVEGLYATMSLAAFSDEMIGVGPTRFLSCDGREVIGIDDKIPDLMLGFKQTALKYCYAMVIEEMRQALISYASASSSKPDKALAINYEEDNFAIFNMAIHVMGYSSLLSTPTLDGMVGISLDDLDYSLDDKELQAGYPVSLMGCRDGKIYQMNDGNDDDGEAIEMRAKGGMWNPFSKEHKQGRLASIAFLVDRVNTTFDVRFFMNSRRTLYQTKTIDCSDTDTGRTTVWRSAKCGAKANYHQIEIVHDTTEARPRIHAMALRFKSAGPMK